MAELSELEVKLRALGGRLDSAPPDPAAMATAVRSRLASPTAARATAWQRRSAAVRTRLAGSVGAPARIWPRRVAVAVVVLCAGAALVAFSPQVRDGIVALLRFAGVEIGQSSHPVPLSTLPAPLPGERVVSLAEARRLAAFEVRVPAALGTPDQVLVSDGTPPRVVSLVYPSARVDQFDGSIDRAYYKKIGSSDQLHWEDVNGEPALWVEGPHAVGYVGRDGRFRLEEARLAGNTLIWQVGNTTLRLEGDFSRTEALRIAASPGG